MATPTTTTTDPTQSPPASAPSPQLPAAVAPVDVSGGVPARIPDPEPGPPPNKVKRAWRWWLGKAAIIGAKQNKVFAWLAFYAGLSPVAWWMRFRKQDRLDRATRPVGDSGWNRREDPIHTDPRRARRPF